jgi:glutathione S-transferase
VRSAYLGPNLKANLEQMEAELGKSAWFAGDELTAADVMMIFPVEAAAVRTDLGAEYPMLRAFLDRVHARPAYKKALERGGPYSLLVS